MVLWGGISQDMQEKAQTQSPRIADGQLCLNLEVQRTSKSPPSIAGVAYTLALINNILLTREFWVELSSLKKSLH